MNSSLILPEYRAKLLHGIVLCRVVLESCLSAGILAPILASGPFDEQHKFGMYYTVRDRVAKLKTTINNADGDKDADQSAFRQSELEKLLQELLKQETEQPVLPELGNKDGVNSGKQTIGIALYPASVFLQRLNNDEKSKTDPNGTVIFNGTYRAIRSNQLISKGQPIRVSLSWCEGATSVLNSTAQVVDFKIVDQLTQQYKDFFAKSNKDQSTDNLNTPVLDPKIVASLDAELELLQGLANEVKTPRPIAMQIALLLDLSRIAEQKRDFKQAVHYVGQCLELPKNFASNDDSVKNLQLVLMIRLCKLQFELFTENDLSPHESITLANNCLVNCSQVCIYYYNQYILSE